MPEARQTASRGRVRPAPDPKPCFERPNPGEPQLKTSLILVAILFATPALSAQTDLYGTWTKKKGNCHEEFKVVIGPKKFTAYESTCRVRLLHPIRTPGKDDYRLDLACDNEGEPSRETEFVNVIGRDQLVVESGSLVNPTKLYRCGR
jgi:hypothetical protein